jgi:two-component system nitrogen regulation response regulator GlnG
VGGQQALKANVRVIAATHQDLEQRVAEGRFREDLFHRLNVIRLRLPPLRERREDIAGLVRHFLVRSAKSLSVEPKQLSAEALAQVVEHPFPGNVRQLENLCHWLTVMAPSNVVALADLPPDFRDPSAGRPVLQASLASLQTGGEPAGALGASSPASVLAAGPASAEADWRNSLRAELVSAMRNGDQDGLLFDKLFADFERVVYGTALERTRGRRLEAASLLGVGRNTITRKIQELALEEPQMRSDLGGLAKT